VTSGSRSIGQALALGIAREGADVKAGIEMLTKQLALELAPHRIRVNAICPGLIETDLNRADIAEPVFRERRRARIPLREIGVPDDLVGAVVFLAATLESRLVTGASVFIDGGQTIWGA
jgi:NAD(P)-dependent dehydrogenase (short-subunit alcohol dehydrogenase family)